MRVVSRVALSWLRAAANSDLHATQSASRRSITTSRTISTPIQRSQHRHNSTTTSNQREDIRPSIPQSHYDFFPTAIPTGPPPSGPFIVDLRALRKEFLQLQAKAHPDLAPASQKRQAEALSSRINEAYKTLQSPLLRAQYLLSQRGIEVAEDAGAESVGQETLMEVLEAREEIEEMQGEEDVLRLMEVNEERVRRTEEGIAEACGKGEWERVRVESMKLRYWINIREALRGWEKGKEVVLQH